MLAEHTDALQCLLDKREIEELVLRYCRAVDRHDWDALRRLYHDDAIDDHGKLFKGPAADYVRWLPTMMAKLRTSAHRVTNHSIVVRGDVAEGEVYIVAHHVKVEPSGGEVQIRTGGRYLDRYTRRDGAWKFQHRMAVMDWNEVQPSLQRWPVEAAPLRDDPSWEFFQWLGK